MKRCELHSRTRAARVARTQRSIQFARCMVAWLPLIHVIHRNKSADIQRINRHIRFVASIDRGRQFRIALGGKRKSRREKYKAFAARHGSQIFRQNPNREQHAVRAKVIFGRIERRAAQTWRCIDRRRRRRIGGDGRIFDAGHDLLQLGRVSGEILSDAQSARKLHNGQRSIGSYVRINKLHCSSASARLIVRVHAGIVKEQYGVSPLARRRRVWVCPE